MLKKNIFFSFWVFSGLWLQAQKQLETELLVVGASTGGVSAALQAARMGVKTTVVEPTSWLGGMLTAAGVSCTDGNDDLHSGLWQEFREALYKHYKTRNLFTGWVSETCFEPHVGDSIFKSWFSAEKNIAVHYGWYFDKVLKQGNRVIGARFVNYKGQQLQVKAKMVVDATDLGDVYADAGAGFDVGMEAKEYAGESMAPGKFPIIQDLTWAAVLQDFGKGADHTIARPKNFDPHLYECCCLDAPCTQGKPYNVNAQKMLDYGRLPGKKYMINWPAHGNDYYINLIDLKPIEREKALEPARQKTLGFIYYVQTVLGLKNYGIAAEFPTSHGLALMPYNREGRRVQGIVRYNVHQLMEPYNAALDPVYRTGISVGDYPVDHHHSPEKKAPGIEFPRVPAFTIPLGALIPKTVEGLVVCEKGISVSNIVNGSSRLQPCVLLTGQAAGALAATAVKQSIQPAQISIRKVQQELLKQNCYLMPFDDVEPSSPEWESIQRIGVTGILMGEGKAQGWANKMYFYPDSTLRVKEFKLGVNAFWGATASGAVLGQTEESLTWGMVLKWLQALKATGKFKVNLPESSSTIQKKAGKPILRKELAQVLDACLNPFEKEINWQGRLAQSKL